MRNYDFIGKETKEGNGWLKFMHMNSVDFSVMGVFPTKQARALLTVVWAEGALCNDVYQYTLSYTSTNEGNLHICQIDCLPSKKSNKQGIGWNITDDGIDLYLKSINKKGAIPRIKIDCEKSFPFEFIFYSDYEDIVPTYLNTDINILDIDNETTSIKNSQVFYKYNNKQHNVQTETYEIPINGYSGLKTQIINIKMVSKDTIREGIYVLFNNELTKIGDNDTYFSATLRDDNILLTNLVIGTTLFWEITG